MPYRHIEPRKILDLQTLAVGTLTSSKHDMRTMVRGAIQFNYGAGLSADLSVLASVDDVNYFDLQLGIPSITGTAGSWGVDLSAFGYPYYKARVARTAGSGTIEIWANAKGA